MLTVLGIDVSPGLLERWVDWLAPDEQPFFLTKKQAAEWGLPADDDQEPTPEQRDTYRTYDVDRKAARISWLTEAAYSDLPKATRAALVRAQVSHGRAAVPTVRRWSGVLDVRRQADGHRFVWWKSLLSEAAVVLPRIVSEDLGPSRHAEVRTWPAELPRARELAGTFPDGSGPNCFGTVMAACGVDGADGVWMDASRSSGGWRSTRRQVGAMTHRARSSYGGTPDRRSSTRRSPSGTGGCCTSRRSRG